MQRRYFIPRTASGDVDEIGLETALELGAELDDQRLELFIDEEADPLEFVDLFDGGIVPPLEHEAVLRREGNVVWLRPDDDDDDDDGDDDDDQEDEDMTGKDIYLRCPFREKDDCKALGGRWDPDRKKWFVPEGTDLTPFKRWLVD